MEDRLDYYQVISSSFPQSSFCKKSWNNVCVKLSLISGMARREVGELGEVSMQFYDCYRTKESLSAMFQFFLIFIYCCSISLRFFIL